jgi:hypothetical protein
MDVGIATWAVDQLWRWRQGRRKVRVLVHQAVFLKSDRGAGTAVVPVGTDGHPVLFWFVKVANLSATRDVTITHLWVEGVPKVVPMIPERPLPARLRPDEEWEGWVPADSVAHVADPARAFRVRLPNGKVLRSRPNKDVPPVGFVAGPGSR